MGLGSISELHTNVFGKKPDIDDYEEYAAMVNAFEKRTKK